MVWDVMPLCEAQLTDVNPSDILCNGLYRKCNTYKGGGGYDKFPEIYQKRYGKRDNLNNQFVVQLRGCPLNCPYCYVTREGVWTGDSQRVTTEQMVKDYFESGCSVFHLMGGAPALYIDHWVDIIRELKGSVFHSDIMLIEGSYKSDTIKTLANCENTLYAVSIKGGTPEEFYKNTRTIFHKDLFYQNLDLIVSLGLPFYFTFTGMSQDSIDIFKEEVLKRYGNESIFDDSFAIDLVHYNALDYVKES